MFALVDCNNFYASCEKIFNPALINKPVVVLSNNDGCIVARSAEAKAIGMKMAGPIFKCQDLVRQHNVQVLSSNYVLYGDMSQRVMNILAQFTPNLEVYSIDEAFLLLEGFDHQDLTTFGQQIRATVQQWTGITVSVGIAATKTLAKAANHLAKRDPEYHGVLCLTDASSVTEALARVPLEDVWGIGAAKADFLRRNGIETVLQSRSAPDAWIKKHLSVITLRTVLELRGVSCIPFDEVPAQRKGIGTSRSFGRDVRDLNEMNEAVAAYTARAAEKLRHQRLIAGFLQVYIATDAFKPVPFYSNTAAATFDPPTAYTPRMVQRAQELLKRIFRPGLVYKRAGVMLMDLSTERQTQQDLFTEIYQDTPRQRLMAVVDLFNRQTNSAKLFWAAEGMGKPWHMRQMHKSQRYTTRWDELLTVRI